MATDYEINPATFITIGTIGPPGQRVFHLQAGDDTALVTLIIEKEQARALVKGAAHLLEELGRKFKLEPADADATRMDMELHEPILPVFRVAQLGLGYDQDSDSVIVVAEELQLEDALDEPASARFFVNRDQLLALIELTLAVIEQGRIICGNCGNPIDPDGHFCPKSNGHSTQYEALA